MKSSYSFQKKVTIVLIFLLLLNCFLFLRVQAPPVLFQGKEQVGEFYQKEGLTHWFVYFSPERKIRKIGITIEPPFAVSKLTTKRSEKIDLYTELGFDAQVSYKGEESMQMRIWVDILSNGDAVFFSQVEHFKGPDIPFKYQLQYKDEKIGIWKSDEIYPFHYLSTSPTFANNQMQFQKALTKRTNQETFFLQTLRYDQVIHQILKGSLFLYSNHGNGLQERIDSLSYSEVFTKAGIIRIENFCLLKQNTILEDWAIFSSENLLSIKSAVTQKILQNLDFNRIKRFSRNGFYYLYNSDGYIGESEKTYYWDYSMYGARSILEYYFEEDSTLFNDIALLSYLALCRTRNPYGYWSNNTESVWLKNDYQIDSHYFDTRFNVDAGIFLLEIYKKFKIPYALTMAKKIGNILLVMMQNGKAYRTKNGGYLLQDYDVSFTSKIKTHSSLNHVLNESSFFLLLYEVTKEEDYLFISHKLVKGIMDTEDEWKDKENGDLFYCRFPDGRFGRQDYVTLTYHDLIRFRRLLIKTMKVENKAVNRLGAFKEAYLLYRKNVKTKKFNNSKEIQ